MMSRNQENVGRVRLAACRECWRCGVGGRAADGEAIYVVLLLIPHCLEMRPCNAAGASSFAQQGRKVVPAAVRKRFCMRCGLCSLQAAQSAPHTLISKPP